MRILWICNTPVPEAAELFGLKKNPFGGWLDGLSSVLSTYKTIELIVAFLGKVNRIVEKDGQKIHYIMYGNNTIHELCERITAISPDIIHIHGVEFQQHYEISRRLDLKRTVASIQGLKSYYAHSFFLGIEPSQLHKVPLSYIGIKKGSIVTQQKKFEKSGNTERLLLKKLRYVIGRTTWDYACVKQVNQEIQYYFNNENLRASFYSGKWELQKAEKHSIFVSQMGYPIKGGHYMLKALGILKEKYPDVHLYVAGGYMLPGHTLRSRMKISPYGAYLNRLIKKYDLQNNTTFTGPLSEIQMKERLLKSHVFVSPSLVENSPNSLGEAMLLGMPCVSSAVGGVQDMMKDKDEGYLYPSDEFYMLAHYVDQIFSDEEEAKRMGENAQQHALCTHDRDVNCEALVDIYTNIIKRNS